MRKRRLSGGYKPRGDRNLREAAGGKEETGSEAPVNRRKKPGDPPTVPDEGVSGLGDIVDTNRAVAQMPKPPPSVRL